MTQRLRSEAPAKVPSTISEGQLIFSGSKDNSIFKRQTPATAGLPY
jgi:hypothetical protein